MQKLLSILFIFLSVALLLPPDLKAQSKTITGQVTDNLGEPLPGVSVFIKGTTTGTITGIDGRYSLPANEGNTLVFQSIGLTSKEVIIGSESTINVSLDEEIKNLDEIVVTGLASSVKRSNLANAVSSVSAEDLVGTTAPPTLDGALYGKLTGANIVQNSGAPGGGISIRLRGVSSITGQNQPLFIVDGVYMDNSELPSGLRFASGANSGNEENASNRIADIDPNDIESMEILKGPSAAAIYGTRANAGVIIITTKRGEAGKTQFSFSQDFGFSQALRLLGPRNWTEERVRESFNEDEVTLYRNALNNGGLIDYEEELYGNTGFISSTRLSVRGGNDRTTFFLSGSVRNEEGIIKKTGYIRRSLRANISHKLSDLVDFNYSAAFINSDTDRGFAGNENEGGLSHGYNLAFTRPWNNLFPDENGNYPDNPTTSGNMLFVRDQTENNERVFRTIQGLNLNFNLVRKENVFLKAAFSGGIDFFNHNTSVYVPEDHQAQRGAQNGFLGQGKNRIFNANYQGFLVLDATAGDFELNSQVGFASVYSERDLTFTQATQLIPGQRNLTQAGAQEITQRLEQEQDFGYIVQQSVNFKDQFIFTAGVRLDKSTLNGDANKLYAFPKASLALNLHKFDFWKNSFITQFKLRGAWGQTGSSAQFGSTFTGLSSTVIGGNGGSTIDGNVILGNPDIEPERASEIEAGFDLGFWDNRLTFTATYYNRTVDDLILERNAPASSGFTREIDNLGKLRNQGIELSLGGAWFRKPDFAWSTSVNFWFNRSEMLELAVDAFPPAGSAFGLGLGTFFIEEGEPVTQLKGTGADGNPITVGDVEPDFQMGISNQITFLRNFDLSFLWHWKKGGDNLNLSLFLTDLAQTSFDFDDPSGIARNELGVGAQRFVENAGYLRLREVALYYTLPAEFTQNIFGKVLQNLKFGVSGYNLITITDYNWYDPEVSTKGGAGLSTGVDVTPFPSAKRFFFHINANF